MLHAKWRSSPSDNQTHYRFLKALVCDSFFSSIFRHSPFWRSADALAIALLTVLELAGIVSMLLLGVIWAAPVEQPGRLEKLGRVEKPEVAEQPELVERPAPVARRERVEQPELVEKPAPVARLEQVEQPAQVVRPSHHV